VRVLQIGESLSVEYGGIAAACAHLSNHLARAGVDVSVMTLAHANGHRRSWPLEPEVIARAGRPTGPARLGYAADAPIVLDALAPQDLIHIHGLWRIHHAQARRFAARRGIPVIVSTHGMLHAEALTQRRALKRVARWLFQDAVVDGARCLHATAGAEADEIRRAGFRGAIAVIPWGVDLPARGPGAAPPVNGAGTRTVLYFGRFHPSKGLDRLLQAWAGVERRFPAWRLHLAGYDEGGYRASVETRAHALGLRTVTFAGPAEGDDRERVFHGADLVVLPSPAENFGFVVPEALARGIPVVATQGSPWPLLAADDCGWWIPAGADALTTAFDDALSRAPEVLKAMGARGREAVRQQFAWDRVTASMVELYEWVLGRRAEPAFVRRAS
jgi:glycosyltransferase involved in cell wall biosynthesis